MSPNFPRPSQKKKAWKSWNPKCKDYRSQVANFLIVEAKLVRYITRRRTIGNTQSDIAALTSALHEFNIASSAAVNWGKSLRKLALCPGPSGSFIPPSLLKALQWRYGGVKHLGIFIGNETFYLKNCDQLVDQISHNLNRWKRLPGLLSSRGRVLIFNNLAASKLWHRMAVLQPSQLSRIIKRILGDFSGMACTGFEQIFWVSRQQKAVKGLWT